MPMLTIRRGQMIVLERERWRRSGVPHLRKWFPEQCAALGPRTLRENVDSAIMRARAHGLELTYDFLRYLNLAMTFGWDFDRNFDWAGEILARREFDGHTRMEMLSQRAMEELHWDEEAPEDSEEPPNQEEEEDEPTEFDGLADEEPGDSIDADTPEPLEWEPEEPAPASASELDPDTDYTAHLEDFRDGE